MHITATPELSVPVNEGVASPADVRAAAQAMFASAEFLASFGGDTVATAEDRHCARTVLAEKAPVQAIRTSGAAIHIKTLLDEYDHQVLQSTMQIRQFVTNRLLEEAGPGQKGAIRALELLGKIAGVDLFVERAEVTVRTKSSEDLEALVREKLARLAGLPQEPAQDVEFTPTQARVMPTPVPDVQGDPFADALQQFTIATTHANP